MYRSTRGHGPVDLADALVQGIAPDGGLYMPETLPRIDRLQAGPLPSVAPHVLAPFLPAHSARWVGDALSFDTPLDPLGPDRWLLDLTRGPTAAFKDLGARFLAGAMEALAPAPARRTRTVLVATSGDTGGAVAAAFHGRAGFRTVVLFPARGVSSRQRRQFTTLGNDVTALGVDGPFDLCQRLVKEALRDPPLAARHLLTSANSINIGRLLPQATWFVKALADLMPSADPVTFIVPSGNLGHLTAGLLAAEMVGSEARFVAALNTNDAFASWLEGRPPAHCETVATPSSAMDVGHPSNLERIEKLLADRPALRERLTAVVVDADDTLAEMRCQFTNSGRFVDPHTAVGLRALRRLDNGPVETIPRGPVVVLATADAGKFPDTVREATGVAPPIPPSLRGLDALAERWSPLGRDLKALRVALDGESVGDGSRFR